METISGSVVGPAIGGGSSVGIAAVSLPLSGWLGENSPYRQHVEIGGTTPYSRIDLLPNSGQLAHLLETGCSLVAENEEGNITVYAMGGKPLEDMTVQASVTEVSVW